MNLTRQQVTTGGLLFIAVSAFILSYDALRLLALSSGVNWWLSLLYPLVFDAVGIVAALIIVQMIEAKDNTVYAWVLTVTFAALSVAGNVLHLTPGQWWLPFVVFAVPPAALALIFHLYTTQLTNDIRRKTPPVVSVKPVVKPVTSDKPVSVKADDKPLVTVKPTDKQAAMLAYLAKHPAATVTEAATVAGVSRTTAGAYVKQLTTAGRLSKNGHGWEVTR
jgi:hypothetical protein